MHSKSLNSSMGELLLDCLSFTLETKFPGHDDSFLANAILLHQHFHSQASSQPLENGQSFALASVLAYNADNPAEAHCCAEGHLHCTVY